MKHREEEWALEPEFGRPHEPLDPMPPVDEESRPEGEPDSFLAMRRIEYVSRLHHMAFRNCLQKTGIPPAQMGALRAIIRQPGMSQRELADALHIQRATATVMLQKMEKSGLILRENDREDQRISRIYPSQYALDMDAENKKSVDAYFHRCFQDISQEELTFLLDVLRRLGTKVHEISEQPESPAFKE